jgi:glutathione S-transferase
MLTLYGIANSRAFRCLWMLEELGREYRHVPTDFEGGSKEPAYLKLNPNGRVPCLVDGELVLFESLAINLYLARRYESPLWPAALPDEARMFQWTFWATNEIDANLGVVNRQQRLPEAQRNASLVEAASAALQAPLRVLDTHLADREYLLGADFSLADLNVVTVMAAALSARYDLSAFPRVDVWLRRCLQRPAGQRAVALALARPAH